MIEEYKGDIGLYLSGQQVKIPSCGIFITQPTIKDIVLKCGENNFMTAVQLLTNIDQFASFIKEGKTELNSIPDFQVVVEVLRQEQGQMTNLLNSFFELCLPQFTIKCSKHAIEFLTEDNISVGMLNTFNYDEFSNVLQELFIPRQKEQEPEYNIDKSDELSRRLLEKIKRNRQALAKQRAAKEGSNISIFGLYISCLSIGLGMNVNLFYDYTPFQLYDSFNRYLAKMTRDKYESMLLVPFADTSKLQANEPSNWMENLYKPIEEEYNSLQGLNSVKGNAR